MDLPKSSGEKGERDALWPAALVDWIERDAHPRFIITPSLDCLWMNEAAKHLIAEDGDEAAENTLTFFDQPKLKALLEQTEDDAVHWGLIPERSGGKLMVWARAIGADHRRLFGLVLTPPDREHDFQEYLESGRLTPAEARIINAVLRGESLAKTATASGVSKETIKTQLRNAYRKLSVSSRGELFAEARKFLAP